MMRLSYSPTENCFHRNMFLRNIQNVTDRDEKTLLSQWPWKDRAIWSCGLVSEWAMVNQVLHGKTTWCSSLLMIIIIVHLYNCYIKFYLHELSLCMGLEFCMSMLMSVTVVVDSCVGSITASYKCRVEHHLLNYLL